MNEHTFQLKNCIISLASKALAHSLAVRAKRAWLEPYINFDTKFAIVSFALIDFIYVEKCCTFECISGIFVYSVILRIKFFLLLRI